MNFKEFLEYKTDKPLYALIGNPVEHSVSPELHNFVFENERIDAEYISICIEDDEFDLFIENAKQRLMGFNVTIPYKTKIMKYLDEIDEKADKLKSVNTVKISNGRLLGYNTDINGIESTLKKSRLKLKDKRVVMAGNGGVAKTIAYYVLNSGAELKVFGRNLEKVNDFIKGLDSAKKNVQGDIFDNFCLQDADIFINATPVGMYPNEDDGFNIDSKRLKFIFDTIYNPLETKLIKNAKEKGKRCSNGLNMLIIQAVEADKIWFNREIRESIIKKLHNKLAADVASKRLKDKYKKDNIVLTGFMGCGKTTVGKALARRMGYKFYDLDRVIEEDQKMTINEIFEKFGEEYFRQLESQYIKNLSQLKGYVLSTGGGALLSEINYKNAERAGLVIYLKSDLEFLYKNLSGSSNRPLLNTPDPKTRIKELLEKREPIYEKHCNLIVDAQKPIEWVVRDIIHSI